MPNTLKLKELESMVREELALFLKKRSGSKTDYPLLAVPPPTYRAFPEEDLIEDVDLHTGMPVSANVAKKNKTPQERKDKLGYPKELQQLSRLVVEAIREELIIHSRDDLDAKCRSAGFRKFPEILDAMNAMKQAADGKLKQK